MQSILTIPKRLTHGAELVVISRKDYERLNRFLVQLQQALAKIRRGEEEYRAGRTKPISSLSELRR